MSKETGSASLSPLATPMPESSHPKGTSIEKISTFERQARLASITDPVKKLEHILENNPRDIPTWLELISRVQFKETKISKPDEVRKVYEKFLSLFSHNGDVYLSYIHFELAQKDTDKVESLFERSLTSCFNLNLWKSYIGYVRKKNDMITGGQEARQIIIQSYDIALHNIGIDLDAGSLWEDYIKFIDEWNPINAWEEQNKQELKRNIFKQAVTIPTHRLEELWSLYTSFENELNAIKSRKVIADVSPQYVQARTWYKEFQNLAKNVAGHPDADEKDFVKSYKIWINLEKQNKMGLANKKVLSNRIEYAYVKTLQKYPFYPEIWFDYADFEIKNSESGPIANKTTDGDSGAKSGGDCNNDNNSAVDNSINILKDGLQYCPYSSLLTYLLAEYYEMKNDQSLITNTFNALVDGLVNQYEQLVLDEEYLATELGKPLQNQLQDKKKRRRLQSKGGRNGGDEEDQDEDDDDDEDNDDDDDDEDEEEEEEKEIDPSMYTTKEAQWKNSLHLKNVKFNKLKLERLVTTVYIDYIKVSKRSIKKTTSRNIFKDARKRFKNLTWHIYYEEALFEYHTASNQQNGTKIALKIFDTGMKNLDLEDYKNYPFLLEYFRFLILVNDYTNIKSLFEICIKSLTKNVTSSAASNVNSIRSFGYSSSVKGYQSDIPRFASNYNPVQEKLVSRQRSKTLKKLFKLLFRYELYNGNVLSIQNLQNRYKEIFPYDSPLYVFSQVFKEYDGLNVIREFDVNVNANELYKSWTSYDTNVNSLLYQDLSNISMQRSSGGSNDIRNKIKREHLLENYDSSSDLEDDIDETSLGDDGDNLANYDLANYGYKSRHQATVLAKLAAKTAATTRPYPSDTASSASRNNQYDSISNNNNVSNIAGKVANVDVANASAADDDYDPLGLADAESKPGTTNGQDGSDDATAFVPFKPVPGFIDDGRPFVSDNVYNLLRVLPNAESFDKKIFDSRKLVGLLRDLNVP